MMEKKEFLNKDQVTVRQTDFVNVCNDLNVFKEKYAMDSAMLGAGAFGTVKKITHRATGNEFAVKIIDKF